MYPGLELKWRANIDSVLVEVWLVLLIDSHKIIIKHLKSAWAKAKTNKIYNSGLQSQMIKECIKNKFHNVL